MITRRTYNTFSCLLILILFTGSLFLIQGCDSDDSNPSNGTPVDVPVFPSQLNFKRTYNDFVNTTGSYTPSSNTVEEVIGSISLGGKTGFAVKSVTTPLSSVVSVKDTSLYSIEGNGDLYIYLKDLSGFVDSLPNVEITNLGNLPEGWYPYLNYSKGIGRSYTILPTQTVTARIDTSSNQSGKYLNLTIEVSASGKVAGEENLTLPSGTFNNTVKSEITISLKIKAVIEGFPISISINSKTLVWAASTIGIVKQETPSQSISIPIIGSIQLPGAKKELDSYQTVP